MSKILGKQITIPADTALDSGDITKVHFVEKTYEIIIGIGNDHTASLYIEESALKALQNDKNKISL
jgi:hypothetical protein